MSDNSIETGRLLRRAGQGDQQAWHALVAANDGRLRRTVALRLDRRLRGRLDVADVIQEVYVEVAEHIGDYLVQPSMPFYVWLRAIAINKLLQLHRHHLGTEMRDIGREVALDHNPLPEAASAALALQLLGRTPRPSEAAVRRETKVRVQEALNRLDPLDREALALRHFEQLTVSEMAGVLGISGAAASKRYFRALQRLREILRGMPGGLQALAP
jgi:RNA polymerase sigma-70 factor (ECF subfamily)